MIDDSFRIVIMVVHCPVGITLRIQPPATDGRAMYAPFDDEFNSLILFWTIFPDE